MKSRARGAQVDAEQSTRYLYYWLLLSLFIEYARPASYFSFLNIPLLYSAIPALLLIVSLYAKGLRPIAEIFRDRMAKWIPIFIGLVLLSILHADVTLYAFNTFKLILGYGMLFLLIARIATTTERLHGVFVTLLLAHLFLLAMNPQVILQPEVRNYIAGATFLGDGNDFSLSLCILIPCTLEVALGAKKKFQKVLAWSGLILMLFAIVASQSRGATLGLIAVGMFLWLLSPRKALSLVGVAVALLIVMLYAPSEYFSRMKSIGDSQEGSAQGRIMAWKASMRMAVDSPLLGVGAGHFPVSFGTRYHPKDVGQIPWLTAHSSYFLVLGELGLPGLIVLLIIVFGGIRANTRLRQAVLAHTGPDPPAPIREAKRLVYLCAAAMVGFAAAGAFLSAAYYPHIFVLTGVLIASRDIARKQSGVQDPALLPARFAGRRRGQATPAAGKTVEKPGDQPPPRP